MNIKEFLRKKPLDEKDIMDIQYWTEDSIKGLTKELFSDGVLEGFELIHTTGLELNLLIGKAFDKDFNLIDVSEEKTLILDAPINNDRYDLIALKYKQNKIANIDSTNKYGRGTNWLYSNNLLDSYEIVIVKGNESENPSIPNKPEDSIPIGAAYLSKEQNQILFIEDKRKFARKPGNYPRIDEDEPTIDLYDGLIWYKPSTKEVKIYLEGEFRSVGGGSINTYMNVVNIPINTDRVYHGIQLFNKNSDFMWVIKNTTLLTEGLHYKFSENGDYIESLHGEWQGQETYFTFIVQASTPIIDALNTTRLYKYYDAQPGEEILPIGIPEFNKNTDILEVHQEGHIELWENINYEISDDGLHINLFYPIKEETKFRFVVWKKVRIAADRTDGSLIEEQSINIDKLNSSLQEKINKIEELEHRIAALEGGK